MKTKALSVVCLSTVLIALALTRQRSDPAFLGPNKSLGARAPETPLVRPSATSAANLSGASQPQLLASYARLPLSFEANHGQTDRQVKFLSRGSAYTLFLTSNETVLSLSKPATPVARRRIDTVAMGQEVVENKPITTTVLRMRLLGANPAAEISGLEELVGKSNYFIGNDPKKWRTNVPNYARVKYRDVYPGVDLVYYGNQRELEYDFVVAPGGDPQAIRLGIEGAKKAVIDAQGDLVLHTNEGDVCLHKPTIYQEVDGAKQPIAGHYVLRDKRQAGFEVGAYDAARPLVIDPVLSYSTYLGGSGSFESGIGIAVDSAGSAYVTGDTNSTNFPTTSGAFQTTFGGGFSDAFVTKLNPAGSALVYSTYLGGSADDRGHGIAVDSAGNAYVTGVTASTNFPTTSGAFQTTFGGAPSDAYVTKLNPAGSALVYSTYLGGVENDQGSAIAVDSAGSAYVTGLTFSTNFPTASPIQAAKAGDFDAFVTKLNAAGSALVYSTYLGGSGFDWGHGIAVDSAGNAYVAGQTRSTNFPTASPIQAANAGDFDVFVTKLNAAGSALVYSTYLGGSNVDAATSTLLN